MLFHSIDAQRSTDRVRIELAGVVLAASTDLVLVRETGRPTRYYFGRDDVRWEHLEPSPTRTFCPFKGRTTAYWSARIGDTVIPDVAWCYDSPQRGVQLIAGRVAFYTEKIDLVVG